MSRHSTPNVATYELAGGCHDEVYGNGNGNGNGGGGGRGEGGTGASRGVRKGAHRRVVSASDVSLKRLRDGQLLESQYLQDEPIPELFLGEPLEAIDESERRTLQTQWADALKRVHSLRGPGAGYTSQSERWSGVATDIHHKPSNGLACTVDQSQNASVGRASGRVSAAPVTSLDHWNYYPGPSVARDTTLPQSTQILDQYNTITSAAGAWPDNYVHSSLLGGAALISSSRVESGRSGRHNSQLMTGRGARSVTTFAPPQSQLVDTPPVDQPTPPTCNIIGENEAVPATDQAENCTSAQGEDNGDQAAYYLSEYKNSATTRSMPTSSDRSTETVPPAPRNSYSALVSRVQRTQSQRYYGGRSSRWSGLQDPRAPPPGRHDAVDDDAPVSTQLKKAVSMREGGVHADAVTQMACEYAVDSSVAKTLQCASCGRSLGVVVQSSPGVDTAFCIACRPSAITWSKSRPLIPDHHYHHLAPTATSTKPIKPKNGKIMRFCRKILRLEKKLT